MPGFINIETAQLLRRTADEAVREVTQFLGDRELGKGGYFRAYFLPKKPKPLYLDLVPLVEVWVGDRLNFGNLTKYGNVSTEKAFRIVEGARDGLFSAYAIRRNT